MHWILYHQYNIFFNIWYSNNWLINKLSRYPNSGLKPSFMKMWQWRLCIAFLWWIGHPGREQFRWRRLRQLHTAGQIKCNEYLYETYLFSIFQKSDKGHWYLSYCSITALVSTCLCLYSCTATPGFLENCDIFKWKYFCRVD